MLTIAGAGGMPETRFHTDARIERACTVLGLTPEQACAWAYEQAEIAKLFEPHRHGGD